MIAGAPQTPRTVALEQGGQQPLPLISVAICTRNRAKLLARAVESVLPQLGPDTELLIVDNASTDETPQIVAALAAHNPAVRVCREATPGIPFARNAALVNARGRHILFFDHDELAEPGWLDAYRNFLTNLPTSNLGCVGGPYIEQHEAPTPTWLDPHYGSIHMATSTCRLFGWFMPATGNCAYPRELVVRMGGFHPQVARQNDTELNDRLRKAGYELWWLESARVRHIIPASRLRFQTQIRLWYAEGRDAAVLRWLSRRTRTSRLVLFFGRCLAVVPQLIFQFVGSALLFLLFLRRRAARLFFRGCRSLGFVAQLLRLGAGALAGHTPAPMLPLSGPSS
jgi:glycosyltransferase involved in cell wall biosynthesis